MPSIRPDARCVSKARRLVEPRQKVTWHTRHTIRVTWYTHHIIALAQDCSRGLHSRVDAWYIRHSVRHTPSKIFGSIDTLWGNLPESIVSLDSFLSLIKSILVLSSKPLSPSHNDAKVVNFFHPDFSTPSRCAASLGWEKGLLHFWCKKPFQRCKNFNCSVICSS